MCKWNKWGDTRIDPCMRSMVKVLNSQGLTTIMCCCGHKKYHMTVVIHIKSDGDNYFFELRSGLILLGKKRFYKRDKKTGIYYIPEVEEFWRKNE